MKIIKRILKKDKVRYDYIFKMQSRLQLAKSLNHIAFHEYKNAFKDKNVYIVAPGPSLKDCPKKVINEISQSENNITIGLNRAFLFRQITLDYLFSIDLLGIRGFEKGFIEYRNEHCKKFIGLQEEGLDRDIPEDLVLSLNKARRYVTDSGLPGEGKPTLFIDHLPLWNSNSIAHQAMQFALFGNPRKIYLIGCDSTPVQTGHFVKSKYDEMTISLFDNNFWINSNQQLIKGWEKIKVFSQIYYPNTEIISINPKKLKGLFIDVFC